MTRTVRDVHNHRSPLSRYRAERLLRNGFPSLRSKVIAIVRSRLRAQGVSLDRADLEGCYAQAWHGLYAATLAGETVESPEAWLVLVTFRRAIDESRSASRAQLGLEDDIAADAGAAPHAGVAAHAGVASHASVGAADVGAARAPDMAAAIDDRARLREVFEALRSRLSVREREAASLCYLQGLSRAQAAARMGIGERRMQKLMEGPGGGVPGVAGKVGELLGTIQAGGWCEQQSSLMRAYAFGILDPDGERHALAVVHTRECPACRARVAALRGLASVLPPLGLLPPFDGSATHARSVSGVRSRLARVLSRRPPTRGPLGGARAPRGAGRSTPRASSVRVLGGRALRRLALAARSRPGSPLSIGGTSGGQLVAGVAACALLAAGGGYALLGAGARGGAVHRRIVQARVGPERAGIVGARAAGRAITSLRARVRTPIHTHHASRARASRRSVAGRSRTAPPATHGPLSPQEFSPERASNEARVASAPKAPAAAPPAAAPGQGEFGVEGR
jgi:DNA-directed RNA polymerase specialized sigma24 family protein